MDNLTTGSTSVDNANKDSLFANMDEENKLHTVALSKRQKAASAIDPSVDLSRDEPENVTEEQLAFVHEDDVNGVPESRGLQLARQHNRCNASQLRM